MSEASQFFDNTPVLKVNNACIFQEHKVVLEDVHFSIEKGEFVYLVGRTGSGKSSLLRTLYADLPLKLGEIDIAGYSIKTISSKEIPFLRRRLGIIFQDFQLFADRTVDENLLFVMKATGWKERSKMKQRLSEVLMQVGLGSSGTKMPHQLSGGEQQRVVIARALINEPILLIADEPTGNLDPEVSGGILELFQDINRSGTTVLMATHNYQFIKNFPSRVLKCEDSKLLDSQKHDFELSSLH
ncbi:ATP-binding cassette domain-containing protein [Porifericola rhodea]|uniref:cell division ATP-binding protein FtsE n=1 Tax=Porifericola rhodea TaxID=930972 RepID=UPI0026660C45|nr:ATP-binding cassette domain-containing protein [Porifericola rhodea]WKN30608.1 ATP-binding cassette domain-containing protein [Porifericola rhodea]